MKLPGMRKNFKPRNNWEMNVLLSILITHGNEQVSGPVENCFQVTTCFTISSGYESRFRREIPAGDVNGTRIHSVGVETVDGNLPGECPEFRDGRED